MGDAPAWDYGKNTDGYTRFNRSLEPIAAPDPLQSTPVDEFFVCNAGHAADLEPDGWTLRVTGSVEAHLELSLADLQAMPQHELTAWLECAGNGRRLFTEAAGYEMLDEHMQTPWLLNGMGQATWKGPRLRDVLERSGLTPTAAWVAPTGLDVDNAEGEPPRMCLPLAKALDADTIIALEMNGAPLARSHGAPARLLVPGWVGAYSMKWLGELVVADEWIPSWRADEYYVLRNADGEATGPTAEHPVKSNLALPFPAALSAGRHELSGTARSGLGPIESVEWRLNDGEWRPAELGTPESRWAWTPFTFSVELAAGEHVVETRAVDAAGNFQPVEQPIHRNGVLWHAITPHPISAV